LVERLPRGKAVDTMNSKGPSRVDPQPAAPWSRRNLLGLAGAAGAVAAVAAGQAVVASPSRPSAADTEVLSQGLAAELSVSDLYALAVAAGVDDPTFATIAANHRAYAEAIGAMIGESVRGRDEDLYAQFESAFDSSDTAAVAATAANLEELLVAAHLQLVGRFEGFDPVNVVTSILVVEGRHATVLTDIAGQGDDLDALLGGTDLTAPAGTA
jgi:hypothetical protein